MLDRSWIQTQLDELRIADLWRDRRTAVTFPNETCRIKIDDKTLLNFGGNDYLGLASHSLLKDAAKQAINDSGWGSRSSPSVAGRGLWHQKLEERLAQFEQTEAALSFSSGYAANVGAITSLVSPGDLVLSDELNHACLIDGCRLSKGKIIIYPHNDVTYAKDMLAAHRSDANRAWIITDTIFSMDGDAAPLTELVDIATKYQAEMIIDEAHATGIYGVRGNGLAESLGVADQILVRIGTLSKAVGCHGGFVSGSRALIDLIRHRARSYVFSTAAPQANAAAAIAAIDWIESAKDVRSKLRQTSVVIRHAIAELGFRVPAGDSPIIPVIVGDAALAVQYSQQLCELGLFVPAIRPPTVPPNQSRLRISLNAAHDPAMLDTLLAGLANIAKS